MKLSFYILILLFSPFIVSICYVLIQSSGTKNLQPADAAVVFGAAVYDTGPSYTLMSRTIHAALLYKKNLVQYIVVSGSGRDNETEEMRKILLKKNIPDHVIIQDPEGFNTLATTNNVKKLMQKNQWKDSIMVSSKYHLARIHLFCRKNKISYQGSAPASIFFPKLSYFYFRETAAFLYYLIF